MRRAERRDIFAQPFGYLDRDLERGCLEEHRKLFSAIASDNVAAAQRERNGLCDLLETRVAADMSVFFVERLEEIDVDHCDRKRRAAGLAAFPCLLEHVAEGAPIGDPGQPIDAGEGLQANVGGRQVQLVDADAKQQRPFLEQDGVQGVEGRIGGPRHRNDAADVVAETNRHVHCASAGHHDGSTLALPAGSLIERAFCEAGVPQADLK